MFDGLLDRVFVGDVHREAKDLALGGGGDLLRCCLGPRLREIGNDDACPFRGEALGDGAADA